MDPPFSVVRIGPSSNVSSPVIKNESPPHQVETRGRGLRVTNTLSFFAAARRASSTRHCDGSRDLRSGWDERLASLFALTFSSAAAHLQRALISTYGHAPVKSTFCALFR